MKSKANNIAKQEIKKALEEDPSVFAYDEVYDDMKSEAASGNQDKGTKKPKYMDNLMKSAELRKREKERREEKTIQKEREQEGDEFKDKEAFVTTAYKEKLKELRETEARERNEAACEGKNLFFSIYFKLITFFAANSSFGCEEAARSEWLLSPLIESGDWIRKDSISIIK